MMFSIGDFVVHPMHGAGRIDDIVEEKIAGVRKEYYVFRMPVGGLVLKIPTDRSLTMGIRGISTATEVEALMDAIPGLSIESNTNWSKRYQENLARLKSGDLYEVARVIKTLMRREQKRGLSTGERKMLYNAKQIMLSELSLVVEGNYEEIENRMVTAMTKGE